MYGGMCTGFFTKSLIELSNAFQAYQIPFRFNSLYNESLISRARNYCADAFIKSDSTHLLFIDSDIEFKYVDVLAMLHLSTEYPNDVICGPYPKKCISWEKVKIAVDAGKADENPNNLEDFIGDYVFNVETPGDYSLDKMIPVREAGTGFMLIPRQVFENIDKKFPEFKYRPDHARSKDFDGSREIMAYFQDPIDPVLKSHLSEDYFFCHRARDAGSKVYICPWVNLNHIGTHVFRGNLPAVVSVGADYSAQNVSDKMKK